MTRTMILALAAAAALAGCNKASHTIVAGGPEDDQNNANAAAPVALPPSITASKSYRCGNNQVVYVDWMSDGSARVKKSRDELGTAVAAGSPELKGDAKASAITYKGDSCTA